jgi:hypothetical protein
MNVKAERTDKHEFTAWTEYGGGFQVITKNAYSYKEMTNQILKFLRNSGDTRAEVLFIDHTDENGNRIVPNEL